jgi:O-antigen/teichoic acid export membrane protein
MSASDRLKQLVGGNNPATGMAGKSVALFISTAITNLVSLLGYFLLTKIYSMEVLGEFFSIFAAASIISVLIHLGFSQAIPLMDEEQVKIGLTSLVGVSISIVLFGMVLLMQSSYLFFVLFAAGILSLGALLEVFLVREGNIKAIFIVRPAVPMISFLVCLFSGWLLDGSRNLIVGSYFLGMGMVMVVAYRYLISSLIIPLKYSEVKSLILSFSNFPRFIWPGLVLHTTALSLPSIVGLNYFGGAAVASYNLAYKFVFAPMGLLGQAIGQAYISRLSKAYRGKVPLHTSRKIDVVLFLVAATISILIFFIFPWVSELVFEENHAETSRYALALIPMCFAMLSVAPLTNLFQFTNNQKKILMIQFLTFLSSLFAFSMGVYLDDFYVGVLLFSLLALARYIFVYFEVLHVRKQQCRS